MPFSQSSQLSIVVNFLESTQPQSIDVGTGMGQYGFLARTNLEHIHLFDVQGAHAKQRPKSDWSTRIDGIEAFETYRTPAHDYAYNHICWDGAQKQVLISTPKTFIHQEVEANPHENHRSVWTAEQLKALDFSQTLPNEESWVAGP